MNVLSLTRRAPVTVSPSTPVVDAAKIMDETGVGALLVVDEGRLVGIVTDRDIVVRGVARRVPQDARIDGLMTTHVLTIAATASPEEAHRVFREHPVRRLPVLDGDDVFGVLSVDDLLVRSAEQLADLVRPIADEIAHPRHEAALPMPRADAAPPEAAAAGYEAARPLRARPGDRLVVHGRTVGHGRRDAEILEVRSPLGDPPFFVRWSDTGQVSFIYPGPDAEVHHLGAQPAGRG